MNDTPNFCNTKQALRNNFVKECFLTSLALGFATVINFLVNLLLARFLIGEHYGDYAVAYRVLIVTGYVLALGSNAAIKKFYPIYEKKQYWSQIKGLLSFYLKGLFLVSLFTVFLGGAFLFFMRYFHTSEEIHVAMLAVFIAPLAALANFFNGIISGVKSDLSQFMASKIIMPILVGIVFLMIISFTQVVHARHAVISCGIALLIICIAQVAYLAYKLPVKTIAASNEQLDKTGWSSFSFSYLGLFVVTLLFNYSSLFLIEIFHFKEIAVGAYSVMLTIASFLWIAPTAINSKLSVDVYYHLANKEYKKLQNKIRVTSRVVLLVNVVLAIGITIFSKELLSLFNPKFVFGEKAFIIMIIADVIYAFALTASTILRYGELHKVSLRIALIFLVGNVILSIPLIDKFGLVGASTGYLITATLLSLAYVILLKTRMKLYII